MRRQIEIDDAIAGRRRAAILEEIDGIVRKLEAEEAKRS